MSDESQRENSAGGLKYYWCVNCGNHGMFKIPKFTQSFCQNCAYDLLTPFTLDEIKEDEHLTFMFKEHLENTPVTGS
jgi:hypothetical protein